VSTRTRKRIRDRAHRAAVKVQRKHERDQFVKTFKVLAKLLNYQYIWFSRNTFGYFDPNGPRDHKWQTRNIKEEIKKMKP
jgi:hypothetical protein